MIEIGGWGNNILFVNENSILLVPFLKSSLYTCHIGSIKVLQKHFLSVESKCIQCFAVLLKSICALQVVGVVINKIYSSLSRR